ncbi:MAG: histidinol-phosphatase [Patescibacteria group bacterium]|nr:histidinol-phosphatase [Patescibacteria group bacterium]
MMEIEDRLGLAIDIAREAGWIAMEYFGSADLHVDRKADDSPVTAADRRAEEHLRHRISETFPDDSILGEELPDRTGHNPFRWILDPIDGTKSFIHGIPLFGTLVGLEYEDRPVLGVIRIPATEECVYASRGEGAWYTRGDAPPRPAHVSSCEKLAEGLFLTSEIRLWWGIGQDAAFSRLQGAARLVRTWGDCYGYMLVATGRADLMIDPQMAVWDAAPLLPILEEAGGTFTDWQGAPTIRGGNGIGTNGFILREALDLIRGD